MRYHSFKVIAFVILPFLSIGQANSHLQSVEGITTEVLNILSGKINEERDWDLFRSLFSDHNATLSVKTNDGTNDFVRSMSVEEFITIVGPSYSRDGFLEKSLGLRYDEFNGIVSAFQSFEAKNLTGTYLERGINAYQLVYLKDRWWIKNLLFVNADDNHPIPSRFLDKEFQPINNDSLTWEKMPTESWGGKQDDICFINEDEGWYINGIGRIFHTTDGGKNWELQLEKKGSFFRCIAFIDENVGFVGTVGTDYFPNVTDTIPLYGTIDGGKTWSPIDYDGPYVKGLCAIDIVKEQYINHGKIDYKYHLYAVGRVGSPANMMTSHDAGKTWTSKSMTDDCKMLFDIKMIDKDTGFACAATSSSIPESNALILKTIDGGITWENVYQSDRPFEGTWKASFPTKDVGYVTIQSYNPDTTITQQHVAKTVDGGKTWEEIKLVNDHKAREFGIGFIDPNHGYVGTMNSGYETVDGGQSWNPINLGRACNKIRIYADSRGQKYGYSIGVDAYKLTPIKDQ